MSDKKVVSLRLDPALHDQLTLVARIQGVPVTQVITSAIQALITSQANNANFRRLATEVADALDQDAARMRATIDDLTGR